MSCCLPQWSSECDVNAHDETLDCSAGAVKAESLPVMDINPTSHVGLHCTGTGQRMPYLEPDNFRSHNLNIFG